MKLSKFIMQLEDIKELYGDIDVKYNDYGYNGGAKNPQVYAYRYKDADTFTAMIDEECD